MSEAQTWTLIVGLFAIQPVMWSIFATMGKAFIDAKFEAVNGRMDSKFETVNVKIDNLDRDVQALTHRVMGDT